MQRYYEPAATDYFFDEVLGDVVVVVGGFEADPAVLPCQAEEFFGEGGFAG